MLQNNIQCFALAHDTTHRPVSVKLIAALLKAFLTIKTLTLTSPKHYMAICFGLAAGLWCTADAFAQERPTSPQSEDTDHPAIVTKASSSVNWGSIRWVERRYKIEAMRFKARDETGIDWWGSDEVMVGTTDAKGQTVSKEIGGIDSGDTHNFDPAKSCIVAVRPGVAVLGVSSVCEVAGEPAPLDFQVEFWEKDMIGFPPGFCGKMLEPGRHGGPHCLDDGTGDDFIGSAQINYPAQELEAALPKVGDEVIESITLMHCPGETCGDGPGPWNFGDYTFTWRVTRLPDALVNLGSLLNEVMQRSGARSELEAITTGLRYLRAPSSRKIEPETDKLPPKR